MAVPGLDPGIVPAIHVIGRAQQRQKASQTVGLATDRAVVKPALQRRGVDGMGHLRLEPAPARAQARGNTHAP